MKLLQRKRFRSIRIFRLWREVAMECRRMHFFAKNRRSIDSFTNWPIDPPTSIKNKAKTRPRFFFRQIFQDRNRKKIKIDSWIKRGLRRHVKKMRRCSEFWKLITCYTNLPKSFFLFREQRKASSPFERTYALTRRKESFVEWARALQKEGRRGLRGQGKITLEKSSRQIPLRTHFYF